MLMGSASDHWKVNTFVQIGKHKGTLIQFLFSGNHVQTSRPPPPSPAEAAAMYEEAFSN